MSEGELLSYYRNIKFKYENDFVEAQKLIEKENNLKDIQIISVNKVKIEYKDVMGE